MTTKSNAKSDSDKETKRRGRKKSEESSVKSIGLFDHIKHIRMVQDPDYFKLLTDTDKKSFNHFMILKALSMNPALLDDISTLFRYFDKIPSEQFYQLLIGIIPTDNKYYQWVKPKASPINPKLIELFATYFEISEKEATEYVRLLFKSPGGVKELEAICENYGMTESEIKEATTLATNEE